MQIADDGLAASRDKKHLDSTLSPMNKPAKLLDLKTRLIFVRSQIQAFHDIHKWSDEERKAIVERKIKECETEESALQEQIKVLEEP